MYCIFDYSLKSTISKLITKSMGMAENNLATLDMLGISHMSWLKQSS